MLRTVIRGLLQFSITIQDGRFSTSPRYLYPGRDKNEQYVPCRPLGNTGC